MALVVTPTNYVLINACEDRTQWTNSDSNVTDFFKMGTQCVGLNFRAAGNHTTQTTGNWDLSGGKHLRLWVMTANMAQLGLQSENGIQLYVSDGSNTAYWTVGGRDTYPGGWYNYVIALDSTPTSGTTPDLSAITIVGLRVYQSSAGKNQQNWWIDGCIVCDGLHCEDSAEPFELADIYNVDNTPATGGWGVIRRIGGTYFLTGNLELNNFYDISESVVFENRPVLSTLYALIADGDVQFGDKVGQAGVSGLSVRTQSLAQTAKYSLIDNGAAEDNFKFYGTSFFDTGNIILPAYSASKEIINCSFEESGKIEVGDFQINNCNFISAKDVAVQFPPGNIHKLVSSSFINNPTAVLIDTAGTYTFTTLTFTGNTHDVENSSDGHVIVNASGSNPSTYNNTGGGTTEILNTQNFTFNILDAAGNPVNDYEWRLYEKEPIHGIIGYELAGEEDRHEYSYTYAYNYVSDMDVVLQILKTGYIESLTEYTLSNADQTVNVTIRIDINL